MGTSAKTVLLVEDELLIALAESRDLRAEGYAVVNASTKQEALDLARSRGADLDLIVMDIDLGQGSDGVEVASEIQKIFDIPIIFLSAHADKTIAEKIQDVTHYGYVSKSLGNSILVAEIRRALHSHDSKKNLEKALVEPIRPAIAGQHGSVSETAPTAILIEGVAEKARRVDELTASVDRYILLMKELQHRIKNSLNLVSSLLSLEASNQTDIECKKSIIAAQNRIKSVALMYELLSDSPDFGKLDCRSYIQELVRLLQQTYCDDARDIEMRIDLVEHELDVKRLVSVGIILNELVTNTLKYAFPSGRAGEVSIAMKSEEGRLSIVVADDGVGLPEGFDMESHGGFGFQLVKLLSQQIQGTMEVASAGGTKVSISFPV